MSDKVGGVLLVIGALFYVGNIVTTYYDGGTQGVNILWAVYFTALNGAYCLIFRQAKLMWSFYGSFVLFLAELGWLIQMGYYRL